MPAPDPNVEIPGSGTLVAMEGWRRLADADQRLVRAAQRDDLERRSRVTSAYTCRRHPAQRVEYMRSNGRRKVLFGTNFPMIQPEKALEGLDALGLDEEGQALFLAGNARRVFRLDAGG